MSAAKRSGRQFRTNAGNARNVRRAAKKAGATAKVLDVSPRLALCFDAHESHMAAVMAFAADVPGDPEKRKAMFETLGHLLGTLQALRIEWQAPQ